MTKIRYFEQRRQRTRESRSEKTWKQRALRLLDRTPTKNRSRGHGPTRSTSRQTEGAAEGVVADAKNGSGQRKKGAKGAKRAKPPSELLSEGDLAELTNLGFSRDDVCKACKALGNLTSNDHNHHNIDSVADWLFQNLNDDNADSVEEINGPILGGPRARVEVDAGAVRSHLEQYVGNGANGMVMAVRSHHSRLVFGSDGLTSPLSGASGSGSPPVTRNKGSDL